MNDILIKNATLTSLKVFLNKKYKKKVGGKFTVSDVQGYIRRGKIPKYIGGNTIELNKDIKSVKLYNVKEN